MRFNVLAVDARHEVVALDLEAASEALAAEQVRARSLTPIEIKASGVRLSLPRRKGKFPATLFSIELLSLLEAGLNLVEALQTLAEKEGGERREVLSTILAAINRGEPFSQAVGAMPQHFSPLYVATIKAAERTGNVAEALGRYIAYQEELDRVRKKIVSASIYPAILIAVGAIVLAFLMFYVVPRFASVYDDMGKLPFFSKLLLSFGSFVANNGAVLALAFAGLIGGALWALTRAEVRAWLNTQLWRIPAIGERMKVYQLARLYRTAAMLLRAGIPAVRALDMVKDLLAAHLRPQLMKAKRSIEQGVAMSAALGAVGLATPVAARMMVVGERSGEMGQMLAQIARFHDDEVSRWVEWFTKAFEPILMAVLGLAIGGVVVLMYMPIFELAGSLR